MPGLVPVAIVRAVDLERVVADPRPLDPVVIVRVAREAPERVEGAIAAGVVIEGAARPAGRKLGAEERTVVAAEVMLPGRHVLLGKGKREFAIVRVTGP